MSENKDYRVFYKYANGTYGSSDSMTKSQAQKYANKCIEYHYECVFVVKEILVLKKGTN